MEGYDYVVAPDGRGDFTTVQEAYDKALSFWSRLRRLFRRARVYVRPGVYSGLECASTAVDIYGATEEQEKIVFEDSTFKSV